MYASILFITDLASLVYILSGRSRQLVLEDDDLAGEIDLETFDGTGQGNVMATMARKAGVRQNALFKGQTGSMDARSVLNLDLNEQDRETSDMF